MKMYNVMKNDFWEFCKNIAEMMNEERTRFDSAIFDHNSAYDYVPTLVEDLRED